MSPLQQQVQAELAAAQQGEQQIMAKLQSIVQLLQVGQIPTAAATMESFLATDLDRVHETQTILLTINIAAMLFNVQQFPLALKMMLRVHPIIEKNFSNYKEIFLPSLDLLGKAHAYTGNVPAGIQILESYIQQARPLLKPGETNPTLTQTEALIVQLYGSQRMFDKAIDFYTKQFEFYRDTVGEASEPAITAINNRGNYYFALKNFDKARADHNEVMRLLGVLQGENHPETVQSLAAFQSMYATHGMQY